MSKVECGACRTVMELRDFSNADLLDMDYLHCSGCDRPISMKRVRKAWPLEFEYRQMIRDMFPEPKVL